MKNTIAQRRSQNTLRGHCAEKKKPTCPQRQNITVSDNVFKTFAQLLGESFECCFGFTNFEAQSIVRSLVFDRVLSPAPHQIATERSNIRDDAYQQQSSLADTVVHESHDRHRDEPSALKAREEKRVGANEL